MIDISKLIDWLKLSPRYLTPIALVTGFLIFASSDLLIQFGLLSITTQYRSYIGLIFLFSSALLVTNIITQIYHWIRASIQKKANERVRYKRLLELTPIEKNILSYYVLNQTRTQYLPMDSGITNGLEAQSIIYRASMVGEIDRWAYNIQPWAWKYLNENPHILSTVEKVSIEANIEH